MKNLALAFILSIAFSSCSSCNEDIPVTEQEKEDFEMIEELEKQQEVRSDSMLKALQQHMDSIPDDSIVDNMTN